MIYNSKHKSKPKEGANKMTRVEIEAMKRDEVRKLAYDRGVRNVSKYTKGQLIDLILSTEENKEFEKVTVETPVEEPQKEEKKSPKIFYVKGNADKVKEKNPKGKAWFYENLDRGDRVIYRKNGKLNSGIVRAANQETKICVLESYDGFIERVAFDEIEFYCFVIVNGEKMMCRRIPKNLFNELKARPETRTKGAIENEKDGNAERSQRSYHKENIAESAEKVAGGRVQAKMQLL